MLKNYSVLPFKNFNCSQNYNGGYSHASQSTSNNCVKSYPIDVVDDIYCGCDEMICGWINGVGNGTVNQLFVYSTTPVLLPNGRKDYITYLITHPNDNDIKANAWVGKIYHRNDLIIHMGNDGGVGSHIDLVVGLGQIAKQWVQNSHGEWVLPNSIKPEEAFYFDGCVTKMINDQGMGFNLLPKDAYPKEEKQVFIPPKKVSRDINKRQFEVLKDCLNARLEGNLKSPVLGTISVGIYDIYAESVYDDYYWINLGNCCCAVTDISRVLNIEPKSIEKTNEDLKDEQPKEEEIDYKKLYEESKKEIVYLNAKLDEYIKQQDLYNECINDKNTFINSLNVFKSDHTDIYAIEIEKNKKLYIDK